MNVDITSSRAKKHPTPPTLNTPWIESPFFDVRLEQRVAAGAAGDGADPETLRTLARHYHDRGYVTLDGVLEPEACRAIVAETAGLFDPTRAEGPRSRYRVTDGWREAKAVRALATHRRVTELLGWLYERRPIPFQTLNFLHGTQQAGHSDAFHFSCRPARFMCGVWVALEDVGVDNGPLFLYPGSHRLPEYDLYDVGSSVDRPDHAAYEALVEPLMAAHGFQRKVVHLNQGDALIWAAHLVHGGSRVLQPSLTRHSQVTHYYFEDCFYFSPAFSNPTAGEYALKEIVDVTSGRRVPQRYNGRPVHATTYVGPRSLVRFDADARAVSKVALPRSPRAAAGWGAKVAKRLLRRLAPGVAARLEAR